MSYVNWDIVLPEEPLPKAGSPELEIDTKSYGADALEELPRDPLAFDGGEFTEVWKTLYKGQLVVVKSYRIGSAWEKLCDIPRPFVQKLFRQFQEWKSLDHPNIVSPICLVALEGLKRPPSFVLPFYQNDNVLRYLGADSERKALPLVLDIAAGLSYLHNLSPPVVHGGVKATNFLVTDDGRAVLSDVGEYRLETWAVCVANGDVQPQYCFMAPELLMGPGSDNNPTTQSDLYGFAMAMFEMYLKGRPFLNRDYSMKVFHLVNRGDRPPRPTQSEAPQLTDFMWFIIEHCWAQDPGERLSINFARDLLHMFNLLSSPVQCI